jgi:hypothetical protein
MASPRHGKEIFLATTGAPAGRVNREKGSDATVDKREIKKGDPAKTLIIQVAALSWAATQVPETTVAIQVGLLFMIGGLHPVTKATWPPSFRKFCS